MVFRTYGTGFCGGRGFSNTTKRRAIPAINCCNSIQVYVIISTNEDVRMEKLDDYMDNIDLFAGTCL